MVQVGRHEELAANRYIHLSNRVYCERARVAPLPYYFTAKIHYGKGCLHEAIRAEKMAAAEQIESHACK